MSRGTGSPASHSTGSPVSHGTGSPVSHSTGRPASRGTAHRPQHQPERDHRRARPHRRPRDRATQQQLNRGVRLVEILKQDQYLPMSLADQVCIIYAGTSGVLDDLPVEQIKPFEKALYPFLRDKYPDVPLTIEKTREFDKDTEETLKKALAEFKREFTRQ